MNAKLRNMPISLIVASALLLFLVILVIGTQMTCCRYMTALSGRIGFASVSKQNVAMTHGEWSDGSDQKTLSINLINAGDTANLTQDGPVRIRLYLPRNVDLSSVKIEISTVEYSADISAVPVGTAVYNLYGEGSVCLFYDTNGEELALEIPDAEAGGLDATLTLVSDKEIDTTGVEIMIEPVYAKMKGGN